MKRHPTVAIAAALIWAGSLHAADWNQYHGIQSDKKTTEALSSTAFLNRTDSKSWKVPTPLGFSSFSVVGKRAFTLIAEEDEDGLMREVCIALDTNTGKRLWSSWLTVMDYKSGGGNAGAPGNNGGDGPRSTPASYGEKVWVYDSDMKLYCLSAKDGKKIWSVDVLKAHDGTNIKWKNASAPLIEGNVAIVYGGGKGQSFLAFDLETGKPAWKSGDETATHATPIAATIMASVRLFSFALPDWSQSTPRTEKKFGVKSFPSKSRLPPHPWSQAISSIARPDTAWARGFTVFPKMEANEKHRSLEKIQRNVQSLEYPHSSRGTSLRNVQFKKYGEGPLQCIELNPGGQVEQGRLRPGQRHPFRKQIDCLSDVGEVAVGSQPSKYKNWA